MIIVVFALMLIGGIALAYELGKADEGEKENTCPICGDTLDSEYHKEVCLTDGNK